MSKKCLKTVCPLWKTKVEVPFEKGRKNDIIWMGESPGGWEERKGKPFWPEADVGGLIRKCFGEVGLEYEDFFWCNAARCRIEKDKLSSKEIVAILALCRNNAVAPIRLLSPKAVIPMGDFALRQVLKKSGITKHRGRWIWSSEFNCWVLPIFHPAYILRNMGLRKRLVSDFKMVREFIDNKYLPPKLDQNRVAGYKEIDSIDKLRQKWSKEKGTIGIDTEGQGKDWTDPNFLVLSFSLSSQEGIAYNVTLYHEVKKEMPYDFTIMWPRKNGKKVEQVEVFIKKNNCFDSKLQSLADLLKDPNIKKYMMNGNFDIHAVEALFKREKLPLPRTENYVMDIQAAANILDENMFTMSSLGDLQMAFTDVREDYRTEFHKKFDVTDMLSVPSKERLIYAASDADVTRRVGCSLKTELLKPENFRVKRYLVNFTMPALGFLRQLEVNGALIDHDKLPKVTKEIYHSMIEEENKAIVLIPNKIKKDYGIGDSVIKEARKLQKFFLTRDELVSDILFGKHGFSIKGIKQTAGKGNWSVSKDIRTILLDGELPDEAREFLNYYDEFSEDHTMWSRYLKGFEKHIKSDGRIHSTYSLAVSAERSSSSNPNTQNHPKRSRRAMMIRELICAPPGYLLMSLDSKQAELRWAAEYSGDQELIRIFAEDIDPHAEVALEFLHKKDQSWTRERWNKLSKREKDLHRRSAKCSNFGLLFGMSSKGLARYARKEYGVKMTEEESSDWRNVWFSKFRSIAPYHKRMVEIGLKLGYVESVLGRRRRLPELRSKDTMLRGLAERQAVHHPIASASSDGILLSGKESVNGHSDSSEIRPILFVHDELVFEVKEDKVQKWGEIVKHHVENPPLERDFDYKMKVPLSADAEVGKNLADLHPL